MVERLQQQCCAKTSNYVIQNIWEKEVGMQRMESKGKNILLFFFFLMETLYPGCTVCIPYVQVIANHLAVQV